MTSIKDFLYQWPQETLENNPHWQTSQLSPEYFTRKLPESREELAKDSRWPAFFPSAISLVTVQYEDQTAIEKVVGASIVNRFPYIIALSFAKEDLSQRHHQRSHFTELIEKSKSVAIQFLPPNDTLQKIMQTIVQSKDEQTTKRLQQIGVPIRKAHSNNAPVFTEAYMVYEATLVNPTQDFEGNAIFQQPYQDVGSHRIYFFEIEAIQLKTEIAQGKEQIYWKSLPAWQGMTFQKTAQDIEQAQLKAKYTKGYSPNYKFPAKNTVSFESHHSENNMEIQIIKKWKYEEIKLDNDAARWPCFFPSSLGMITSYDDNQTPNLMPCGSTTLVSRHPLIISPCICYASINDRYAKRSSLENIRKTKKFGCGVAYIDDALTEAIKYSGSLSITQDPQKIQNSGLKTLPHPHAPIIHDLPIHFDCEVVGEILLGTHTMLLGEVKQIYVHKNLSPSAPFEWYPWSDIVV
ncbi:MAG: flavin reductase family protein [Cytophagales bacterium]|nr:MAG: flavin reductase family protein [Cytophagales bacterium]